MANTTTYNIHIDVIAEPLGKQPANVEYNPFGTCEQAKDWLNAYTRIIQPV